MLIVGCLAALVVGSEIQSFLVRRNLFDSPERHVGDFNSLAVIRRARLFLSHPICTLKGRAELLSQIKGFHELDNEKSNVLNLIPLQLVSYGAPNEWVERLIVKNSCHQLHVIFNDTHKEALQQLSSVTNITDPDVADRFASTLRSMLKCRWIRGPWTGGEGRIVFTAALLSFVCAVVISDLAVQPKKKRSRRRLLTYDC